MDMSRIAGERRGLVRLDQVLAAPLEEAEIDGLDDVGFALAGGVLGLEALRDLAAVAAEEIDRDCADRVFDPSRLRDYCIG
jgi:hypothetical protein